MAIIPKHPYDKNRSFGQRMHALLAPGVDRIAEEVAKRFLKPGSSAFISDGASTFSVGLHWLAQGNGPLVLYTNNLALAHEIALWREREDHASRLRDVDVHISGGRVDADRFLLYGSRANRFAAEAASKVQYTIVSVAAMHPEFGPAGREHYSLQIKQHAADRARQIVWVADGAKLTQAWQGDEPLVFSIEEWKRARDRKNMWLVASSDGAQAGIYDSRMKAFEAQFGDRRVINAKPS